MSASSGLITDRYGVPQYNELFEEHEERAWDLFHGREGQDGLQIAPVHLRAGLTGAAYESGRKLEHSKMKTKNSDGKATDVGMKPLLNTLKESITAELPVKTRELFFHAFYSPNVWRKNCESMQQYIVRREQDFKRLEDNSPGTQVSEQVRAMMLLCLGGLDPKEQTSVLSSCNNTYKFERSRMLCGSSSPMLQESPYTVGTIWEHDNKEALRNLMSESHGDKSSVVRPGKFWQLRMMSPTTRTTTKMLTWTRATRLSTTTPSSVMPTWATPMTS